MSALDVALRLGRETLAMEPGELRTACLAQAVGDLIAALEEGKRTTQLYLDTVGEVARERDVAQERVEALEGLLMKLEAALLSAFGFVEATGLTPLHRRLVSLQVETALHDVKQARALIPEAARGEEGSDGR